MTTYGQAAISGQSRAVSAQQSKARSGSGESPQPTHHWVLPAFPAAVWAAHAVRRRQPAFPLGAEDGDLSAQSATVRR